MRSICTFTRPAIPDVCFSDVVKVRLMTDKNREIQGVMHCIRTILVKEGPMAFYKGFGMCWGRVSAPLSIVASGTRVSC